jgi:hypothetical protein
VYHITTTPYGYKLVFADFIKKEEMERWYDESKKNLVARAPGYGVLIDMRTLKPLPADAQAVMEKGQALYKQKGMLRSAVVLSSPTVTMQFQRIAKQSGIDAWERYIDASRRSDWEAAAVRWASDGVDPDVA